VSDLVRKQQQFAKMVGQLIAYIYTTEYAITFGEAWRTEEQAAWNAAKGVGIKNSLHCSRLAIDLNFFDAEGGLVPTPEIVGEYWESLGGAWGGRFADFPHFSLAYGGRK
jgi:hypothetical protein